ncbi:hypothetical protein [Paraburkholderia xenovorans]
MTEIKTLGDALLAEIARVTVILGHYVEIGPAGAIGAMLIRASLDRATRAAASGDVVAMIEALDDLKGYSE